MFKYKFANDWSQTADLWYQKRPLYQLSHNHFPTANYLIASQCIFYLSFEKKIPCLLVRNFFKKLANLGPLSNANSAEKTEKVFSSLINNLRS